MQAITTYHLPPTNFRGSRIVAKAAKRIVLPWDHALSADENHRAAAEEYAFRLGWLTDGRKCCYIASGGNEDGSQSHVLVNVPNADKF